MELTQEQLDQIINSATVKLESKITSIVKKHIDDIPEVDTRNLASKKHVSDCIESLKTGLNEEITKLQTAIKQVADETDVKIQKLTPPKEKPWWGTVIDYSD